MSGGREGGREVEREVEKKVERERVSKPCYLPGLPFLFCRLCIFCAIRKGLKPGFSDARESLGFACRGDYLKFD